VKKYISIICTLAILLVLLSGCLMVSLDNFPAANAVQGTGEVVYRRFSIPEFTGIDINGDYTVVYKHSDTHGVTVIMQENLFHYLNVGVQNGILNINSGRPFRTGRTYTPIVHIYAPYLNSISFGGSVTVENWDKISTQTLTINAGGAINGSIHVNVDILDITVGGAADFVFTGTASSANINLAGSGEINAENLQTENAIVNVAGAGTVDIAVSKTLNVIIAGAGTVQYIGNPRVSQSIAGVGRVRQRD